MSSFFGERPVFQPPPARISNFVIGHRIGAGAYAEVYSAKHYLSGEEFAVKVFPRSNLQTEQDRIHLQREVDAMALLQCESIVRLHHFSCDDQSIYLVMDLCPGGDLFQYISTHGPFEEPVAALVFKQLVGAIAYCHMRGVAHRDLKPENILFTEFPMIKLSDFGLCGYLMPEAKLQTFCGSPCYFAPEILMGAEYDGARADIWSLGIVLFVMVTGMMPWNPENESRMQQQIRKADYYMPATVSRECQDLIRGLIRVNPMDRFPLSKILSHPWLGYSEYALVDFPEGLERALSAIKALDLEHAVDPVATQPRMVQASVAGIISPFVDAARSDPTRRVTVRTPQGAHSPSMSMTVGESRVTDRLAGAAGIRLRRNKRTPVVQTFTDA
jgi:serine/threonine protein kinase